MSRRYIELSSFHQAAKAYVCAQAALYRPPAELPGAPSIVIVRVDIGLDQEETTVVLEDRIFLYPPKKPSQAFLLAKVNDALSYHMGMTGAELKFLVSAKRKPA